MKYKIGQDFEYLGNDYWQWRAWIDADKAALDRIAQVVWILHPTFSNPRVVTKDRKRRFMLKTAGWGTFRLRAEIDLRDGTTATASRNLTLEYPDGDDVDADAAQHVPSKERMSMSVSPRTHPAEEHVEFDVEGAPSKEAFLAHESPAAPHATSLPRLRQVPAAERRQRQGKKVFLSYGSEDAALVEPLRHALTQDGLQVLDVSAIADGASWQDEVNRLIARSDMVIGVVGHDYASPFVVAELGRARGGDKPVCVVTSLGEQPFGLPTDIARIPIDMDDNKDFKEVVAYVSRSEEDEAGVSDNAFKTRIEAFEERVTYAAGTKKKGGDLLTK